MTEKAVFGGGCFWCTEAVFSMIEGVIKVTPGYAGGVTEHPNYKEVSKGNTGHAEVVQVEYDPQKISYKELLAVFFSAHDPTVSDRQGDDIGPQYRSIILTVSDKQAAEANEMAERLEEAGISVVTEIKEIDRFYPAEKEHENYYLNHKSSPYCVAVIDPKLVKIRQEFSDILKKV